MDIYGINIRQPLAGDIVGNSIALAAIGTAFEATYRWKLVRDGKTLAEEDVVAEKEPDRVASHEVRTDDKR